MGTVSFGGLSTGKSGPGISSAIPSPFTPIAAQAARARVGPRSGPPCFLLPPTMVGAIPAARRAQAAAPGQPREAIRSPRASPTVGGGAACGSGQRNHSAHGGRIATSTNRGRSWETPWSLACTRSHQVWKPSARSRPSTWARYPSNLRVPSPRTFSSSTARGPISSISRSAWGNRSRSSSEPSCFPAIENGGQGTPPANRSTPANARPSTFATSPSMTFHCRLQRSVPHASASSSTTASWANPACSRPSAWPPAPAQISSEVSAGKSACATGPPGKPACPTFPPAPVFWLILPAPPDSRRWNTPAAGHAGGGTRRCPHCDARVSASAS